MLIAAISGAVMHPLVVDLDDETLRANSFASPAGSSASRPEPTQQHRVVRLPRIALVSGAIFRQRRELRLTKYHDVTWPAPNRRREASALTPRSTGRDTSR